MTEPTNTLPEPYQSVRLKPCPCGSEDIQHSYGQIDGNMKGYTILCRDCGYYVEDCEDKSAVEKWNRRRRFTDTREYRAWVRAVTELSTAIHAMDNVPFLGMGPEARAECKDIRDRMDELKSEMVRKIEQMEGAEMTELVKTRQNSSNEELKPCPFCGMTVHWDDLDGIIHDKVIANCIVDLVQPMDSNSNLPKEFWIKRWNWRGSE